MEPQVATAGYGEVFTRRWIVETILDLVDYTPERDLAAITAVEPAVGEGAFFTVMVERLIDSASRFGHSPNELRGALRGFDIQANHVIECSKRTASILERQGYSGAHIRELLSSWLNVGDFLLNDQKVSADVVVGNPPYIRADDLAPGVALTYRRLFTTMRGRADIYIAFYEKALQVLKPGGLLGFICADRWMRNAYGAQLRSLIGQSYSIDAIWTMHDVDAFESEVDAYPAITVVGNHRQGTAVIADCKAEFDNESAQELLAFSRSASLRTKGAAYKAHRVDGWFSGTDLWPAGDPERVALLDSLAQRLPTMEEAGIRVGIGIATGADKAYIVAANTPVEADRKLPLIMANDIRSGKFGWTGKVLLNPWDQDGRLVDLKKFPLLAAMYNSSATLRNRFVAKKNPDSWYRTIDKINYAIVDQPKLVLQGMKSALTPVLEEGGHYPHHNLYVLTSGTWDLKVLGGLLLSDIAQSFIEAYGVRMRGGTLRFQSQYLRKIRVPEISSISEELAAALAQAFDARDRVAASRLARVAYGVQNEV